MATYSIELKNVTKRFGNTVALDNINISLEQGKVYGLVGRNGAGKTTLLKTMSGMLRPDQGTVTYIDSDLPDDICFMRDANYYFNGYNIKSLFYIAAKNRPNWDYELQEKLVKHFEIPEKKYYLRCSKGIQTLVSIVIALCSGTKTLFLDEPYSGLDPVNRESFYEILRDVCFDGEKTVVISSHLISEIEGYFEKAIIIDKGKVLVDEDIETIYERSYVIRCSEKLAESIKNSKNVLKQEKALGEVVLYVYDDISEDEEMKWQEEGATFTGMDLQKFFVTLCGRMEEFKW